MAKIIFVIFFCLCSGISCIDEVKDSDNVCCLDACSSSFPAEAPKVESCARGCRLYSIIDTVEQYTDANATQKSCEMSCVDAYGQENDRQQACIVGCTSQEPFLSPIERQLLNEMDNLFRPSAFDMSFMYPFMYSHDTYGNIVDKMHRRTQVSWSFYVQNDNGKMIVIQSQPVKTDYYWSDGDMTRNYIETNIEPMDDNVATPDLPNDHFDAARPSGGRARGLSLSQTDAQSGMQSDWISCFSNKTGLPKVLLTFVLFLSAMGMVWLCISTTVTASEQRVTMAPQKISLFGDLDYMKNLGNTGFLTKVTPIGPDVQAPPLPLKLTVQTI